MPQLWSEIAWVVRVSCARSVPRLLLQGSWALPSWLRCATTLARMLAYGLARFVRLFSAPVVVTGSWAFSALAAVCNYIGPHVYFFLRAEGTARLGGG